jgi:glyoxylase-like metal-dependent hydrolase (beta-lactamase superfamily II)
MGRIRLMACIVSSKEDIVKPLFALLLSLPALLIAVSATGQVAHMAHPILDESTTKISDHVWEITGFPNIAIIVGSTATLVVDTGLGPKNGATAARVAARLAPNNSKLFLTTTHFHPEHAAGEPGFPRATILIRDTVQQQEMEQHGQEMLDMFRGMTAQNKELLSGVVLRAPDVTFDHEAAIDLGGGVKARLLWFGGAHTKGDELTLVEPDHTLISGDVVQNKTIPFIFGDGGTPTTWLAVLDKVAMLNVAHVVPDHSASGDGSLVAAERDLILAIRTQALALKHQGVAVEAAGTQVSAKLKSQHPDWPDTNASEFVKSVYLDPADPK